MEGAERARRPSLAPCHARTPRAPVPCPRRPHHPPPPPRHHPFSLHSVHEGEKPFELELAWVCEASGRAFQRVPADVAAAAEAAAKAALAESDMED